jgi:outer membrane protein assembly factor BamB
MKRVALLTVGLTAILLVVAGCPEVPPAVPVKPIGPDSSWSHATAAYSTASTDPKKLQIKYVFDWGDGSSYDTTNLHESGDTASAVHTWDATGSYSVTAMAINAKDLKSGWSDSLVVKVSANRPPNTPATPSGPSTGGTGVPCSFTSSATDPYSDSVGIRFAWGDGDTSGWSSWDSSGADVAVSYTYADSGTYSVTAQARDVRGSLSSWSAAHTVTITAQPPSTLKWRYQTGNSITSSPAVGADGTIYVGSRDDDVYAINPDGTLKWRYPTGDYIHSSPAVGADGTVYVGSYDCYLYAFNPDGTFKWHDWTFDPVGSSPAVGSDGAIYVGSDLGCLYAVSPGGAHKWSYQTGSNVFSSPAVGSDGTIYFGSGDGYVYAINPDGTFKWRYPTGDNVWSSPAIGSDGTIYVGSGDIYLYAINPDGTLKWRYQAGGQVNCAPAIGSDGTIYVGSDDGCLYAVNPDSTLKWRYETGGNIWSSPTIGSDGTVYVGSDDGCLYAIAGSSPLATSAWPKFRHDLENTGRVGGGMNPGRQ